LTLASRFLGFGRDLAISYTMGASASIAADAWNTALAFPNMFRRIFAEGAFSSAFVPAYTRSLRQDGEEVADVLAADAMATLAAATIVLTVVAQLTMPWLMYVISPGFRRRPRQVQAGRGPDPDHHALPAVHAFACLFIVIPSAFDLKVQQRARSNRDGPKRGEHANNERPPFPTLRGTTRNAAVKTEGRMSRCGVGSVRHTASCQIHE